MLIENELELEGFKSMDCKVSDYIPDLRGPVYDNATIRQLLTMTSGVK